MPTIVWVLIWIVVLGAIAFFVIRERRAGHKQPSDFDRTRHEAVGEAQMNHETRGPRTNGSFFGS